MDDWSLADWCDQCHRKGGLVIGANPRREGAGPTPGETLADLILGKIDALEIFRPRWEASRKSAPKMPPVRPLINPPPP